MAEVNPVLGLCSPKLLDLQSSTAYVRGKVFVLGADGCNMSKMTQFQPVIVTPYRLMRAKAPTNADAVVQLGELYKMSSIVFHESDGVVFFLDLLHEFRSAYLPCCVSSNAQIGMKEDVSKSGPTDVKSL